MEISTESSENQNIKNLNYRRVVISEIISSRYPNNLRPENWKLRKEGIDLVKTTDGQTLEVFSNAGQSPPQVGWHILLKNDKNKAVWTLYGM
jgi:hypothetical protein